MPIKWAHTATTVANLGSSKKKITNKLTIYMWAYKDFNNIFYGMKLNAID